MEQGWPPGDTYSRERPAVCRRALSVCDSLDLQGAPASRAAPALQAALYAGREQTARPRSVCSGGPAPPPTGARSLLLGFLRPRLGRRGPSDGRPPAPGPAPSERLGSAAPSPVPSPAPARRSHSRGSQALRPRPTSMTFLEVNRLELAEAEAAGAGLGRAGSAGFLRGASLWSSQRWQVLRGGSGRATPSPRRGLSALKKSFSFRLRRGQEIRRAESGLLPRVRTRSDGDSSSLGAFPSRRDLLLGAEAPRGAPEPGRPRSAAGLWKLLTSRFRRRDPPPEPAPAEPLWSRRAARAPGSLGAPSGKGTCLPWGSFLGGICAESGWGTWNLPGRGGRAVRSRGQQGRPSKVGEGPGRWSSQTEEDLQTAPVLALPRGLVEWEDRALGPFLAFGTCGAEAWGGKVRVRLQAWAGSRWGHSSSRAPRPAGALPSGCLCTWA